MLTAAPLTTACVTLATGADGFVGWTPAKVNLFLEVLGRRADGYHEVETLVVAVNLFDTLEATARGDGRLLLHCDAPGVPTGPTNLVLRAAEALRGVAGRPCGATLRLTKRVPHEAGLGGGSSNAALTLALLNRLWKLDLGTARLVEIAATLGSDVGVFLGGAAGWCTGRGEVIEPTALTAALHFVVVKPPYGLSTAAVYTRHAPPANRVPSAPLRASLAGGDLEGVARGLHNRLEAAAFAAEPRVKALHDRVRRCGALGVLLSGSGSCVFALARDGADAARVARELEAEAPPGARVFVVRSL